jgi:diketogulonate reductase-like aldo/keto reductase
MLTRPIPSTGEAIPVIGIGTWQGFDIGRGAERTARREVLATLFAAGGTVIDSSPMYGRAEAVVGEELPGTPGHERAFVATKVWTRGRRRGIRQMTESIRLLGKEPIDLMQIHNLVDWRTQLETLHGWRDEGRIRYIGITHYTTAAFDDLEEVLRDEAIDFVQLPYSIGLTSAAERLLPLAADRGVAVMVNRPFDGGGLFASVRNVALPDWASESGCASWSQYFLEFILAHPAVTCVIPGTGNPDNARAAVAAGSGRVPDEMEARRMREYWQRL